MTPESNDQQPDDVWRSLQAPEPDDRWAEVDRRLDGLLAEDRPRRRPDPRRLRRWALLVVAIIVVGLAAGWFIGSFPVDGTGSAASASSRSTLRGVIAFSGIGIALVVWITGLVLKIRRRGIWVTFEEPTRGLPRAERRAVERTIRGRGRVDPERVWTLRRLAIARLDQTEWTLWLFAGWLPLSIGQAAAGWGMSTGSLHSVLAVFWAGLLVVATLQRRRWRAFLAAHPVAEPVSGS